MRSVFSFVLLRSRSRRDRRILLCGQSALLYPAGREKTGAREAGLPDFEDVTLTTEDRERIVGWYKPAAPGRATLLYFHGNGGSLLNRRDRAVMLTEGGRGLLIVSYRGYSGSTGTPSEAGLRIDARTAYAWLAARAPAERLVLYGESLGSGVAVRLATEKPIAGLILDAAFTSAADVAGHHYWYCRCGCCAISTARSTASTNSRSRSSSSMATATGSSRSRSASVCSRPRPSRSAS